MSLANGFNRVEGETATLLRRCAANVTTALDVLARPPSASGAALRCVLAAVAGDCCCHRHCRLLLLAWTLDAAASRGAGHLPRWIIDRV
jgi:hypothetical protein